MFLLSLLSLSLLLSLLNFNYYYSSGLAGYKYLRSTATCTASNTKTYKWLSTTFKGLPGGRGGSVIPWCLENFTISPWFPVTKFHCSLKLVQTISLVPSFPWNKWSTPLSPRPSHSVDLFFLLPTTIIHPQSLLYEWFSLPKHL